MIVLGISDHFVSGAALLVDGRVVSAINEERLARKKMVMGFPWKSIEAVMKDASVSANDVDKVAVASKWGHFLPDYVDMSGGIFDIDEGPVKKLIPENRFTTGCAARESTVSGANLLPTPAAFLLETAKIDRNSAAKTVRTHLPGRIHLASSCSCGVRILRQRV